MNSEPREPEIPERIRYTRTTHTRSRKGCQECRRRHVRCDEKQPLCTSCLTRGDTCIYNRLSASGSQISLHENALSSPISGAVVDPFGTIEIEMPYETSRLLHHFVSYRNELRKMIRGNLDLEENVLSAKYEGSSAYTRSLLLMSAKHRYGLTGKKDWCREPTYLHHKAQVIRLLKEQLGANPADPGDWSFSVILFLLAMESLEGDHDAATAHIRGLVTLMKTKAPHDHGLYKSGQVLLKLSLLILSLLEAAKIEHAVSEQVQADWLLSRTSFALTYNWQWVNVVYLLVQIVGEFLVKDGQLIATAPSGPEDSASLQWLLKELRSFHSRERNVESRQITGMGAGAYQDPQLKNWVLAGTCYALLLASLPELNRNDAQSELHYLQVWWEEKANMWMESLKLPGSTFAVEVLDKVAWLTSIEGEKVIQQLYETSLVRITV